MSKTFVGLFATVAKAEEVKLALVAQAYSASVVANGSDKNFANTDDADSTAGEGVGQKISNFFHSLTAGTKMSTATTPRA